jgi:AcrR family transcriptional regulator
MPTAPLPRGRPRKGEERSQSRITEITDAAARLFVSQGYEQTSLQDIGAAIGMLKGSLYYYIDSREELLFWVLRRNHARLHEHTVMAVDYAAVPPAQAVATFVERHVGYVLDNAGMSALYAQRFASLEDQTSMREEILALRRGYEGVLIDLVTRAQAGACTGTHLDPTLTARSLLAMSNAAHAWFRPGGRLAREDIIAHHAALAVRAVAPDPAAR